MPYKDIEVQRKYQRERLIRIRLEYLYGKVCVRCGASKNLEIDHIDPSLKISHNVWSWSEERRLKELAKCQVLCHSCHVKKTHDDRGHAQHGSAAMYNKYGCRCEDCKMYHRLRFRRIRANMRESYE